MPDPVEVPLSAPEAHPALTALRLGRSTFPGELPPMLRAPSRQGPADTPPLHQPSREHQDKFPHLASGCAVVGGSAADAARQGLSVARSPHGKGVSRHLDRDFDKVVHRGKHPVPGTDRAVALPSELLTKAPPPVAPVSRRLQQKADGVQGGAAALNTAASVTALATMQRFLDRDGGAKKRSGRRGKKKKKGRSASSHAVKALREALLIPPDGGGGERAESRSSGVSNIYVSKRFDAVPQERSNPHPAGRPETDHELLAIKMCVSRSLDTKRRAVLQYHAGGEELRKASSRRLAVYRRALAKLIRTHAYSQYGALLRSIEEEYARHIGLLESHLVAGESRNVVPSGTPVCTADAACLAQEEVEEKVACFGDALRAQHAVQPKAAPEGPAGDGSAGEGSESEGDGEAGGDLKERVEELEALSMAFLGGLQAKDEEIARLKSLVGVDADDCVDVAEAERLRSEAATHRQAREETNTKWLAAEQKAAELEAALSAHAAELASCKRELERRVGKSMA